MKEEIKSAFIDALKDPVAAQLLSEQIDERIKKLNADEAGTVINDSLWIKRENYISCISCIKHSDNDKVPASQKV